MDAVDEMYDTQQHIMDSAPCAVPDIDRTCRAAEHEHPTRSCGPQLVIPTFTPPLTVTLTVPVTAPPAATTYIATTSSTSSKSRSTPKHSPANDTLATHPAGSREYHQADTSQRPPYSYAALIYLSMKATDKTRVQLGEIYNNIMDQWAYYHRRPSETGWKNSIRHNLTVSKCFSKVARCDGDTGKGGYWQLNEVLAHKEITLQPRENMPKAVNRGGSGGGGSKSKSKKKSKGVQARDSKSTSSTGTKPMPKSKSKAGKSKHASSSHAALVAYAQPTLSEALQQITQVKAEDDGHADHADMLTLESAMDYGENDDLDCDVIDYPFGNELEQAMNSDSEDTLVPDSCKNEITDNIMDGSFLSHSLLDAGMLESSFSNFLDCTKDLNASQSFSAFPTTVIA